MKFAACLQTGPLWFAVIAVFVSSSGARADNPPRDQRLATIVKGTGAGSDKAAAFVDHFARQVFFKEGRYEVIDMVETLGSPDIERARRAFQVAEEMYQKGKTAYESLDLDPAVEYLNTALTKYERHAGYVEDLSKVADALMLLGATHILRGEERTGAKRLAQAVAIYPAVEPDPRIFNPSMRQVFQRAADRLAARPPGALAVGSNPSYAAVYVDGVFVGVTPAAIENVPEGRHYVRVVKSGYRSWGKLLDVVGASEASDTAELKPTNNLEDFENLSEEAIEEIASARESGEGSNALPDAVEQLGVLLNVDQIFLAEVALDGERVELQAIQYDLNNQVVVGRGEQTFSYDSRPDIYEREVQDVFQRSFSEAVVGPVGGGTSVGLSHAGSGVCYGMSCEKFKLLVLAGGAGGGALLMGVGAIMWGLAKGDNNDYSNTPQISEEADSLKRSGQTKALVGDALFFVGVAAAVTGVSLYLLWTPSPSTDVVAATESSDWSVGVTPVQGGAMVGAAIEF